MLLNSVCSTKALWCWYLQLLCQWLHRLLQHACKAAKAGLHDISDHTIKLQTGSQTYSSMFLIQFYNSKLYAGCLMLLLHRVIAGCLQSNRRDYNISDQTITSRQVAVYCLLAFVTKAVCRLLQSVVLLLPAQGYCGISSTPICTCCTPFLTIPSTSDRFIRLPVCRRLCSKIRTVCCLRPIVVLFCLHRVIAAFPVHLSAHAAHRF
jgi:hypothetical protein